MSFDINRFKGSLKYGGARKSKFEVTITNPANGVADSIVPFMVSAASIPPVNTESIPVPYMGREIKLNGKRTYEDWNVTVFNDEDFLVRNALEQWANDINSPQGNLMRFGSSSPSEYKSDAQVTQFSKTGEILRVYTFVGLFPTSVGEIELNWEDEGIQTFQVTFAYDYFYVNQGVTGLAGGI